MAAELRDHYLLNRWRADLIDILSAEPELLLQHACSLGLVTARGYKTVRDQHISTEKVTVLLDLVIDKGSEAARDLLKLLRNETFQDTFPRLSFLKNLPVDLHLSTGRDVYVSGGSCVLSSCVPWLTLVFSCCRRNRKEERRRWSRRAKTCKTAAQDG